MTTTQPTRFEVRVVMPFEVHEYEGIFPSKLDARMDAVERFWNATKPIRIRVRAVKGGAV